MLKTGILHPQLARVLAELRHKDTLVIGDAGLPIPKGVERIDLGWRPGDPAYLDVLEEILKYIVVEKATFADEALRVTPEFHEKAKALLPAELPVEYSAYRIKSQKRKRESNHSYGRVYRLY